MTWDGLDDLEADLRASPKGAAVLTGAGISVASGIPSFRGDSGIWTRYDPADYATIDAFDRDPERVWRFLAELAETLGAAEPNDAHRAIARLEARGYVAAVLTQNVDGLHQAAGSSNVVELHGGHDTLSCRSCGKTHRAEDVQLPPQIAVPTCRSCDGVLKPDVVLFGEPLPPMAVRKAEHAARNCGVMLVVGTSAEVYPVAGLPDMAARAGATIWEVNPQPSVAGARTIAAPAEDVLPVLAQRLVGRDRGTFLRRLFGSG
ncbi:MAG: NAD-dependent deacylase [Nitriliruptorales bacterium]|nr:NAD-dependent deacylase [Nitriliruptorales bacterium]